MQIPSLPTDNLYKILAIFGLVIVVLSVVYPLSKSKEFAIAQLDLSTKMSARIIELKKFTEELKAFVEEENTSLEEYKTLNKRMDSLNRKLDALIKDRTKVMVHGVRS